jgi:twinkle protein
MSSTPLQFSNFNIDLTLCDDSDPVSWVSCPQCVGALPIGSTPLQVSKTLGQWQCHHCNWRGSTALGDSDSKPWLFKDFVSPFFYHTQLLASTLSWFEKRHISPTTVSKYKIGRTVTWCPEIKTLAEAIAVPYIRDGLIVNVKHRFGGTKGVSFYPSAESIPFGLDDMSNECTYICENEVAKMAMHSLGIQNVISLPNGIPKIPNIKKRDAQHMEIVHECLSFLDPYASRIDQVKKFVICLGTTHSATVLTDELARRLGRDRCWIFPFPENIESLQDVLSDSKDNNYEKFHILLNSIRSYPVKGVFELTDVIDDFNKLYNQGLPPGPTTGWSSLDDHYRPAPGQWTLVTGIPSHGKSNFLDALFCNLSDIHDWKFCIFSPENQPIARHFANLAEKYIGAPFNPKDKRQQKMSVDEKDKASAWLNSHFSVVLPDVDDGNWSIDGILDLARTVILRKGVQGLIIDPWNELDHARTQGLTETEHVSRVLSRIRQFARAHSVHIWLVAHPTKMHKDDMGIYPVPTPYDVSGSSHFLNKADFCLCVYRFVGSIDQTISDIYIQKVRFKENGSIGRISLRYFPSTGQFIDDIDQNKRQKALNTRQTLPVEQQQIIGSRQLPEFIDPPVL